MEENIRDLKALFVRLSCGDMKAFDAIFHSYYVPLVLFANTFVHDKEAAEDIVSEIFCKLWSERTKYENITQGKSYLFTSVKNRSLDLLRKHVK